MFIWSKIHLIPHYFCFYPSHLVDQNLFIFSIEQSFDLLRCWIFLFSIIQLLNSSFFLKNSIGVCSKFEVSFLMVLLCWFEGDSLSSSKQLCKVSYLMKKKVHVLNVIWDFLKTLLRTSFFIWIVMNRTCTIRSSLDFCQN